MNESLSHTLTEIRRSARDHKRLARARGTRGAGRAARDMDPNLEAAAQRFVDAYNGTFKRRVTLTADLARMFARRVEEGHAPESLVCVPILTHSGDLDVGIRRRVQVGWLLRDGSGSYERDGIRRPTKNWIGDALQNADRAVITPRLREVAEKVGVVETLQALGATFAEED